MTIAPDQLVTWVTAVAGVGVAVVGGIAGYLSAGWRFREVQLSYEQKTRDSYLDNARKVAADVYVPLSVAVSALSRAYLEFKVHIDSNATPIGAINRFKGACRSFERTLTGLTDRGATAYLTLSLEEKLVSFSSFLNESLTAQTTIKRLTLQPKFYGVADTVVYRGENSWLVRWSPVVVAITQVIPIAGVRLRAISETLCAPIASGDFEKRFREDTLTISALIKEVTLGSRSSPTI
ncbi:hypothetical protein [Mesorhizobium sp. LNHC209A00]|uniref:hypothetical protein n=1 Tax=Mesorhizobium TaxID=68287 RepID=UPI0003D00D8D|nr:hypothetical protein [Mesorhizobium sp. LNHC209A00]ESY94853.1 hypothetical protein X738_23130 [Mesorhizobium sp. LNHC209A00]